MPLPNGLPTPLELAPNVGIPRQHKAESLERYQVPQDSFSRASVALAGLSPRRRRKVLAQAAMENILAVLDPASKSSTKDRGTMVGHAIAVAGLSRDAKQTNVSLVVTFKGLRRDVVDASTIEARVVEAAGLPPLASPLARQEGGPGGERGD